VVNRKLPQHKTTTTATIDNDWPFNNRNYHSKDISIRHSHSGDYDDDDDHDDDDDDYSDADDGTNSSGTDESIRSAGDRSRGVADAGLVTSEDRHPLSTPNRVPPVDEQTLRRRPTHGGESAEEKAPATKSDPLISRNIDVKQGRKQHLPTTKPHSTHARNKSTKCFFFLCSLSASSSCRLLITTSVILAIRHLF